MSGVRIEGDISSLKTALEKLTDLDLKELNEAIGDALVTSTALRFRNSEDPDGNRWKQSVRARDTGGKTLVKTGDLKNSISSRATGEGVAVGTNKVYAGLHQFGTENEPGGVMTIKAKTKRGMRFRIGGRWVTKQQVRIMMPRRAFLGISKDDLEEIRALCEDFVKGAAGD